MKHKHILRPTFTLGIELGTRGWLSSMLPLTMQLLWEKAKSGVICAGAFVFSNACPL